MLQLDPTIYCKWPFAYGVHLVDNLWHQYVTAVHESVPSDCFESRDIPLGP